MYVEKALDVGSDTGSASANFIAKGVATIQGEGAVLYGGNGVFGDGKLVARVFIGLLLDCLPWSIVEPRASAVSLQKLCFALVVLPYPDLMVSIVEGQSTRSVEWGRS